MASRSDGYMYSKEYSSDFTTGYYKLKKLWNNKSGMRDFNSKLFINTTPEEKRYHIPSILYTLLNNLHKNSNIINELRSVDIINTKLDNNSNSNKIWIYNMKIDSPLPETPRDLENIYRFVRKFIEKHFDDITIKYLNKEPDISVYFFIWFFTTPNIFNIDEKKEWEMILLRRVPIYIPVNVSNILNINDETKNLLEKEKKLEENKINALIKSVHPTCYLDESNQYQYKLKLLECMTINNRFYIGEKKSKILHELYQNYVNIINKINVEKIELDDWRPPPLNYPKLETQIVVDEYSIKTNKCIGCINNQPNQLAHMDIGGCLYYSSEEEEFEYF